MKETMQAKAIAHTDPGCRHSEGLLAVLVWIIFFLYVWFSQNPWVPAAVRAAAGAGQDSWDSRLATMRVYSCCAWRSVSSSAWLICPSAWDRAAVAWAR